MGDRGNVVIRQGDSNRDDVWIYTHWGGAGMADSVKLALGRRQRWSDESYLARIVFCEMVSPDFMDETGFGLSTRMQDNEHPILVVDVPGQCVWEIEGSQLAGGRIPDGFKPEVATSFNDYCQE
jgi:hypothetical protein